MSFETPLPPYASTDPSATFLSSSVFDLLLIELVPLAYRLANELDPEKLDGGMAGFSDPAQQRGAGGGSGGGGIGAGGSIAGTQRTVDEDEERDRVFYRLESLGYRVGQGLVERFAPARPHFTDPLDAIKFLCKDLWTILYTHPVSNLKTNHRGVFVLTDTNFKPFQRMSVVPGEVLTEPRGMVEQGGVQGGAQGVKETAAKRATPHLFVHCGLVRGALAAMGLKASVQAETNVLPVVSFHVRTVGGKS